MSWAIILGGTLSLVFRIFLLEYLLRSTLKFERHYLSRILVLYTYLAMIANLQSVILNLVVACSAPMMAIMIVVYDIPFFVRVKQGLPVLPGESSQELRLSIPTLSELSMSISSFSKSSLSKSSLSKSSISSSLASLSSDSNLWIWVFIERIMLHTPMVILASFWYVQGLKGIVFSELTQWQFFAAMALVFIPFILFDQRILKRRDWPEGFWLLFGGLCWAVGFYLHFFVLYF